MIQRLNNFFDYSVFVECLYNHVRNLLPQQKPQWASTSCKPLLTRTPPKDSQACQPQSVGNPALSADWANTLGIIKFINVSLDQCLSVVHCYQWDCQPLPQMHWTCPFENNGSSFLKSWGFGPHMKTGTHHEVQEVSCYSSDDNLRVPALCNIEINLTTREKEKIGKGHQCFRWRLAICRKRIADNGLE